MPFRSRASLRATVRPRPLPIVIDDRANLSTAQIRARVKSEQRKGEEQRQWQERQPASPPAGRPLAIGRLAADDGPAGRTGRARSATG